MTLPASATTPALSTLPPEVADITEALETVFDDVTEVADIKIVFDVRDFCLVRLSPSSSSSSSSMPAFNMKG